MVCLRFCQHSDVTFLKEFQHRLNSRYLASTFFSLYTLISLNTLVTLNRTSVSATSPNTLRSTAIIYAGIENPSLARKGN